MTNRSYAIAVKNDAGQWIGVFSPCWTSHEYVVTDDKGNTKHFRSAELAECHAWRRLHEVEEARFQSFRTVATDKKAEAERLLREALREVSA